MHGARQMTVDEESHIRRVSKNNIKCYRNQLPKWARCEIAKRLNHGHQEKHEE